MELDLGMEVVEMKVLVVVIGVGEKVIVEVKRVEKQRMLMTRMMMMRKEAEAKVIKVPELVAE